MEELSPHRIGEFLKVVFRILWSHPEGLAAKEILAQIPKLIPLSEYETGVFPSSPNSPRYETIIRLATVPLLKAGWLTKNDKGRWHITEDGRQACRQFVDAGDFYKEASRLYGEYFEHMRGRPTIFLTLEEAKEKSWEQIHDYLSGMRPYEFKKLVADLLYAMGYHVARYVSSDRYNGKIDYVAYIDPLGMKQPRIVVEVKHKGQPSTVEGIKDFLSIIDPVDFGILVSSGGFTNEAKNEAGSQKDRRIVLIDLEVFYELWIEHYAKLSPAGRSRLPLETVYFLAPFE